MSVAEYWGRSKKCGICGRMQLAPTSTYLDYYHFAECPNCMNTYYMCGECLKKYCEIHNPFAIHECLTCSRDKKIGELLDGV